MAKKLLALLVAAFMVLGVIPAAAFAKTAPEAEFRLEPVQRIGNAAARGAAKGEPAKDAVVSWDFETDPATDGWNFTDADNDGKNWTWTTEAYNSGSHSIKSASYEGGVLTPDNWAQSPRFDMPEGGATLTFQVENYNASYPEVFEVWYAFDGMGGMQPLAANQTVSGNSWVEVSYQIPDSDGAQCMIAIRHYGCTDQWKFYIDDVEISAPADPYVITTVEVDGFPTRIYNGQTVAEVLANVAVPENAHYIIDTVSAFDVEADEEMYEDDVFEEGKVYLLGAQVESAVDYSFADDAEILANGGALELEPGYNDVTTYIAYVVPAALTCGGEAPLYGWYFENEDELEGWSIIDNDGDNSYWYLLNAESLGQPLAYEGEGYLGSPSWNSTALTPDNFVIGPEVEIPEGTTTLSFYAAGTGADWCQEHFAVYMVPVDSESIDEFVEIMPETVATADYVNYTVDLSEYAGETIRFAFRHFNCTDLNWLRLDQVEIFNEGGDEPELIPIEAVDVSGIPTELQEGDYGPDLPAGIHVPEGAPYTITSIGLVTAADYDPIANSSYLVADTEYFWQFNVAANEGYYFTDDCALTANGGELTLIPETGVINDTRVWMNCEGITAAPLTPPAGDLDEALNAEGGELHFETSEDYPWETFTDGDRLAAWSTNKGVSSSTSAVWTTVTANAGDVLNFDFMAWGEGTGGEVGISSVWDKCEFYVDEELVLKVGALQDDWTTYTYTFTSSGEHTLTWQYVKDGSVNPTGDYFAIDEVELVAGEEPPVEPTVIDTIEINGFVEPAWGEAPFYAVTVPEDAHYSIDYTDWNWYDAETEDGDIMGEGELFNNEGYVYYQYFEIIPEEGYVFADDVTILVNGDASVIETKGWSSNYGCEWAYTVDFTVEEGETPVEPTVVDTVYVNNFEVPPVAGENPLDHLNLVIPEGEPYTLDMSTWFNEESFSPQTDAFEEGHIYSVAFQVILPEGYEFASDVAIILDGGAVGVSEYVYNYGDHLLVYTIPYEAVAGAAGILGDVNLDGEVTAEDALLAMRYAMGVIELTDEQLAQMEVDGNGEYDLVDALLILRYSMQVIDHFPAEELQVEPVID